ncbi:MAG: hypothetical protein LPK00_09530 [Bacillaceae bacterium]|nr:hypothetical protein [Bacillaceae bacterium]
MIKEKPTIWDHPICLFGIPTLIMTGGVCLLVMTNARNGALQFIPAIFILLGLAELVRSIARMQYVLTRRQQSDINQKSGYATYILSFITTIISILFFVMGKMSLEAVLYIQLSIAILIYPILQLIFIVRDS